MKSNSLLVVVNDDVNKRRLRYEIPIGGRTFDAAKFYRVLSYLNFRITPSLSKENLKYYCRSSANNDSSSSSDDNFSGSFDDSDIAMQTLCVVLFLDSPELLKQRQIVQEFRQTILKDIG